MIKIDASHFQSVLTAEGNNNSYLTTHTLSSPLNSSHFLTSLLHFTPLHLYPHWTDYLGEFVITMLCGADTTTEDVHEQRKGGQRSDCRPNHVYPTDPPIYTRYHNDMSLDPH